MVGKKKKHIKTWQLLLILIPLFFLAITALRLDHIRMTELRSAVLEADESEDNEKITSSLNELKKFTINNIVVNVSEENGLMKVSFGTGPFYLEKSYLRAASAAIEEAEKNAVVDDSNPNGNIYALASSVCRPLAIKNGWTWTDPNYINCFMDELAKYPASEASNDTFHADIPSTELYRYEFSSPIWAPSSAPPPLSSPLTKSRAPFWPPRAASKTTCPSLRTRTPSTTA